MLPKIGGNYVVKFKSSTWKHPGGVGICPSLWMLGFFEMSDDKSKYKYGDPLEWIWLHAETIGICLHLKCFIDRDDTNGIL